MQDIKKLENKYLKAKITYYEGNPTMSDLEFDELENYLKLQGSKVIEQVGSKRKHFDFEHPTKMLSLSKVQTEKNEDGSTNYMAAPFLSWYNKRKNILRQHYDLLASPKFDGSAINITYHGINIFQVTTRGDGFFGKDVTRRFLPKIDNVLILHGLGDIKETDIIQIRCEVVVNKILFEEKYFGTKEEGKFANPRNYVAGVIGKDDYSKEKMSELTVIPLHFIVNGKQVDQYHFSTTPFCMVDYNLKFDLIEYVDTIKYFEEYRKTAEFLLDGVVIAFPAEVRSQLGENDHDPEWSYAVKFIPEDAITNYSDIEYSISKRGELVPVVIMEPVQLAGTTVKRASGYNAGYIVNNKIGPGAKFSVAKAGDIIPEIQNVIIPATDPIKLPTHCPSCQTELVFDSIHLKCQNEACPGRIAKKLASASGVLDLKSVGGKTLEKFANDFPNMYELWKWALVSGCSTEIEKYGIKYKSRSHEIFLDSFTNIKSIPYEKVIIILGYDNVGKKLSKQVAIEHAGMKPDYTSLEKALVAKLHTESVESYIKEAVSTLESLNVIVDRPAPIIKDDSSFGVCLTGSPKVFGFKTKKDFLAVNPNLYEEDLKSAKYLITDDLTSTSSKMKKAAKKGIEIKTYNDFNK